MNIEEWRARGRVHEVNGHSLFVVDTGEGDLDDRPTLVLLHGYPTSSHDYYRVLNDLAETYRVVVHDHLGFGFAPLGLRPRQSVSAIKPTISTIDAA